MQQKFLTTTPYRNKFKLADIKSDFINLSNALMNIEIVALNEILDTADR